MPTPMICSSSEISQTSCIYISVAMTYIIDLGESVYGRVDA